MDREEGFDTGGRSKLLEDGTPLPWRLVNFSTWVKLAKKLDPNNPISNNDWRGLAEHLGFNTEDILALESSNEGKTVSLLKSYMRESGASVNRVVRALRAMQREDALLILLDAVPDIEQKFLEEQCKTDMMQGIERDEHCKTETRCRCQNSSSLHYHTQNCPASCSPYDPHHHPACSLLSSSCCCHHHPNQHQLCHCSMQGSRMVPYSSLNHFRGSPPSGRHHHANISTATALPSQGISPVDLNYNIMSEHANANHLTAETEAYKLGQVPRSLNNALSTSNNNNRGPSPMLRRQHMPPAMDSFARRQVSSHLHSVSMVVQPDMDCREGMLPSFPSNVDMLEANDMPETPASLPAAIARGLGHVSMGCNGQQLNGPMEIGREDDSSTSSNDCSSMGSGYHLNSVSQTAGASPGHRNIERQVSEECNVKQPYSGFDTSALRRVNEWNIDQPGVNDAHGASRGWPCVDKTANKGNIVNRTVGGAGFGECEKDQPLQQLVKLSQLPEHFKPDPKYKTIVAEQQIDDLSYGKSTQGIKQETNGVQSACLHAGHGANSKVPVPSAGTSGNGSSQTWTTQRGENPNTFPMRVKPQGGGATVEKMRKLKPGQLTKTVSVPMDMKMEEFKKAFRHIKVFVTYANDGKHHSHQVLSLCNCLDRNGFSCCVDVYSQREVSSEEKQASRDWCTRKFREADFVLVCLSPQYVHEIKKVNKTANTNSQSFQHAAHIYHLMQQEYEKTRQVSRFIALYLEGAQYEGLPPWLARCLRYHWPQQYKDLLWMLTKPEERIKPRAKASAEKNCSMLKNGHCMAMSSSGY